MHTHVYIDYGEVAYKHSNGIYINLGIKFMEERKMKKNKCLLVSFILGLLYSIYIIAHFTGAIGSTEGAEQVGVGIATAIVMPHMVVTVLATIFNGLGYFLNKAGFALVGAILYAVAMVLFPLYFLFVILQMILSFVGFSKIRN